LKPKRNLFNKEFLI